MKIADFVKIKEIKDLVDTTGGGSNSTYIQNKIHECVLEGLADGNTEQAIKLQVERLLGNYEIQTKKLENQTEKLMKKWGFNFD